MWGWLFSPHTFSGGFSLNNPSAAASPPAFVGRCVLYPYKMRLFSQQNIHCCCRTSRQVPPGGTSTSGALCSHSSSPSVGKGCAWCLFTSLPALLPSFPPINHNRLCAGWGPRAVSTLLTQTVAFLMADPEPPSHSPRRQDAQKEHSSSSQHCPRLPGRHHLHPCVLRLAGQSSLCPARAAPASEPLPG